MSRTHARTSTRTHTAAQKTLECSGEECRCPNPSKDTLVSIPEERRIKKEIKKKVRSEEVRRVGGGGKKDRIFLLRIGEGSGFRV